MNIAEEIRKKIRQELEDGATQKELARKYGMTQGNISRILSGMHSVSFDVIERMFPNLHLSLDGDKAYQMPSPAEYLQSQKKLRQDIRASVQREIIQKIKVSPHLSPGIKQTVQAIITDSPIPDTSVSPAQAVARSYGIAVSPRQGAIARRTGFSSRLGRLKGNIKNSRGGHFGGMQ